MSCSAKQVAAGTPFRAIGDCIVPAVLPGIKNRLKREVAGAAGRAERLFHRFTAGGSVPLKVSSAPVSLGSRIPSSYVRRSATKPQLQTDLSGKGMLVDAERIDFSDMIPITVQTDATPHIQTPFYTGASYLGNVIVSPGQFSARLQQLEEMYGYYAFRKLRITFIPATGSSTAGSLALAVDMDVVPSPSNTVGITYTATMQHAISEAGPVWEPFHVDYTFTGSKLWNCSTTASADTGEWIQAVLWGSSFNTPVSTIFGKIHVEGVLDFYKMNEVLGSPSLRERRVWDRFVLWEWIHHQFYTGDLIPRKDFFSMFREKIIRREREKLRLSEQAPVIVENYDVDEKKKP